jgi:hypothetical protein
MAGIIVRRYTTGERAGTLALRCGPNSPPNANHTLSQSPMLFQVAATRGILPA